MKIEIIKGVYNNGKGTFGAGQTMEIDDGDALSLISLGMARKIGGKEEQPAPEKPAPDKDGAKK